jgi:hypothetical protein
LAVTSWDASTQERASISSGQLFGNVAWDDDFTVVDAAPQYDVALAIWTPVARAHP